MLQVIDYGIPDLFELINTDRYSKLNLKIGKIEFELPANSNLTITQIPSEIFKKIELPSVVSGYLRRSDEILPDTMGIDEYKSQVTELLSKRIVDKDSEEWIWEVREDKNRYDTFVADWQPIYTEPSISWQPIEFYVVKKEYIPEKYQEFIYSSIVVDNAGAQGEKYRAICTYTHRPTKMLTTIANALGFAITKNENAPGKSIFLSASSPLQFSKVAGAYVPFDKCSRGTFRDVTGTLEECIAQYDREYQVIFEYFAEKLAIIENKKITEVERSNLIDLVSKCMTCHYKLDPKKSDMSVYNSLGGHLDNLRKLLTFVEELEVNKK